MSEDSKESKEPKEPKEAGILRKISRRILGDNDLSNVEPKEVLHVLLETGDKAKTEIVRLLAREVRSYLEAMDLHNDVRDLLGNYSLEVKASFSLKPLNKEKEE